MKAFFGECGKSQENRCYLPRKATPLLFGLPGNPVSAYMCYRFYIAPYIAYLRGKEYQQPYILGEFGETIRNPQKRAQLFRVRTETSADDRTWAYPIATQASHMLSGLIDADGFVILQPETEYQMGQQVRIYSL